MLVMRSVSSCHAVSRIAESSEISMNRTLGCFCGRFQASLPLSFTARGEEWEDSRAERGENGDDDYHDDYDVHDDDDVLYYTEIRERGRKRRRWGGEEHQGESSKGEQFSLREKTCDFNSCA